MIRRRGRRAMALVVTMAVSMIAGTTALTYDPCDAAGETGIESGEPLTVGIAYWPGGTLEAWGDLHPCEDRGSLTNVGTTTFVVNSGEMSALRGTVADEDGLYGSNTVMTVVAYTATKRSEPRVVRMDASESTNPDGKSGRVSALTLLATLEDGDVKYLRWHDMGCGDCGGASDSRCLAVGEDDYACSASLAGCDSTCSGDTCDVDLTTTDALRCQLTVAMATSGTDSKGNALELGTQLERLSSYATTGAYASAAATSAAAVNGVTTFFSG